ncbi:ROK family transcriptional regulator [Radiobacillus kanasensis]|uniref:ROK family transcriptional regulator n=1 Tax=Radiobacillus kanasensis TaxID=2844358 RepID=UPI001E3CC1D4|nr:ROK family transcriptional regulator [Radiobacillus kanasensis]UFT98738.1 ROK family transcriptional regulator [Radiobacillus kanasensis]
MEMNQTWNQYVVKKGNKSIVLEKIIESSPISRADIAQQTGLNKGTVSSLVSELLDEQLIYESGPGESSGGRRPVMLLFNQVAGYSIGIDLGVNYLLGILVDLQGNIVTETKINYNQLTYQEIESKLFEVVDQLTASAPPSPYGIVGIGVGVPGTVNNHGEVMLAPNLGWKNVHLKSILERKYDIPITIVNEANAGAYGEKRFGAGLKYDNIVYISAGIGIGVGLILDGKLYTGSQGFSGELGHMTIQVDGKKCRCGNEGCWELYASEQALLNQAKELGLTDGKECQLDDLIELAKDGDKQAIELFQKVGDYLGVGINNVINIFNPEQIVIGNQLAATKEWILDPLNERITINTLWYQQNGIDIHFSKLGIYPAALGVSALSSENFLNVDLEKKAIEV